MPKLSQINIFPIKSCRGISLERAVVERRGLRFDRRWMIVDANYQFLTQRKHPQLAVVEVEIDGGRLIINAPSRTSLSLPARNSTGERVNVTVWSSVVAAVVVGPESDQWFSELLGFECHLVHMEDDSIRPVKKEYSQDGDHVSFADAFPYMLISEASLEDLNQRLKAPVPMNRFRPNFVLSGCGPFEEDTWKVIRIGSVAFRVAKPCDRCITTTVDQATGIKGTEPFETLTKYRNNNGGVFFGQNLIADGLGSLSVGEEVIVEQL